MKSLEFMANGIAMVVSPYMHSDKLEHNKSVMIATTTHEWYEMLKQLVVSEELRRTMGENARQVFANYHTYANTYAELRYILLP
ncbi:MAG TPA: glycosyltransferase, partial [Bacteroidales bacterium]|nr:glycosyltransferase [Bacteroidales bacterium]